MTECAAVGLRLLLVEDSAADAALVTRLLESGQEISEVTRAATRREALERLLGESFDLALVDLHLPDSQGLETLSAILRAAPHLPVVVLTGIGTDDILAAAEALRLGAQDYILKQDLQEAQLRRALLFSLERKRHEQQTADARRLDPTSGLLRLQGLREEFEAVRARCRRSGRAAALVAVALGEFGRPAETRGEVLQAALERTVALHLRKNIRRYDAAAVAGGGRYLLLLDQLRQPEDAEAIVARIVRRLEEHLEACGLEPQVRLLAGVSVISPEDTASFDAHRHTAERRMRPTLEADPAGRLLFAVEDDRVSQAPGDAFLSAAGELPR